ncbi:PH domain-like protein, partial [Trichoderma longibrachiatum ATCC 18648]
TFSAPENRPAKASGLDSPFNFGGGSSLATTPAGGTPEPSAQVKPGTGAAENNDEEGEKHEQISLTEGAEKDEDILHEVRAKVLKFVPMGEISEGEEKKAKNPWVTKGVGSLRLLKHKETSAVRLLLRAEPRGNVAMNRIVLPDLSYKANEKYVKMTTSNETGDGLETWMIQVKTKELAKELGDALEKNKAFNKK